MIRLTALQFSPLLHGLTPRNAAVGDAVHQRVAADAVRAMVNGEIDPKCPASILQLHRNVTVLLDREAAAEL